MRNQFSRDLNKIDKSLFARQKSQGKIDNVKKKLRDSKIDIERKTQKEEVLNQCLLDFIDKQLPQSDISKKEKISHALMLFLLVGIGVGFTSFDSSDDLLESQGVSEQKEMTDVDDNFDQNSLVKKLASDFRQSENWDKAREIVFSLLTPSEAEASDLTETKEDEEGTERLNSIKEELYDAWYDDDFEEMVEIVKKVKIQGHENEKTLVANFLNRVHGYCQEIHDKRKDKFSALIIFFRGVADESVLDDFIYEIETSFKMEEASRETQVFDLKKEGATVEHLSEIEKAFEKVKLSDYYQPQNLAIYNNSLIQYGYDGSNIYVLFPSGTKYTVSKLSPAHGAGETFTYCKQPAGFQLSEEDARFLFNSMVNEPNTFDYSLGDVYKNVVIMNSEVEVTSFNAPFLVGALMRAEKYNNDLFREIIDRVKSGNEDAKLNFLSSFGYYLFENYDDETASGIKRDMVSTEELLRRINAGEKTGAVCTHIHAALVDVAERLGFKAQEISVASSSLHAISALQLKSGKVALLDYGNLIITNSDNLSDALVEYEKQEGAVIRNKLVDWKTGKTTGFVNTGAERELRKIMTGINGGQVEQVGGFTEINKPNRLRIRIDNKEQEVVFKEGNWLLEFGNKSFAGASLVSIDQLDYFVAGLDSLRLGMIQQSFKPYKDEAPINSKVVFAGMQKDITVNEISSDTSRHNLSLTLPLSVLISVYLDHDKYKDNFSFLDTNYNDTGVMPQLKYAYVDPLSPNEFYFLVGSKITLGVNAQSGAKDIYPLVDNSFVKIGGRVQARKGTIFSGEFYLEEHRAYQHASSEVAVKDDELGSMEISTAKNKNTGDFPVVSEKRENTLEYESPVLPLPRLSGDKRIFIKATQIGQEESVQIGLRFSF